MAYSNESKVVGHPCRFCGTPYIEGKKGAYCLTCYKKWKEGQNSVPPVNPDYKSYKEAQEIEKPHQEANRGQIQANKEVDWDRISFGKCKHAFLLESYKKGADLATAEPHAEKWAEASMRILKDGKKDSFFAEGTQVIQVDDDVTNIPF